MFCGILYWGGCKSVYCPETLVFENLKQCLRNCQRKYLSHKTLHNSLKSQRIISIFITSEMKDN
jgi:hypothetical protein